MTTEYGELQANGTVDLTKNSGNIGKQTVSFSGLAQPFVQTFVYDSLQRLTEAKETNNGNQTWREVFDYDRYGNRTTHNKFIGTTQVVHDNKTHPVIDSASNRFQTTQGFTFDANGNIITDADGRQFTFNGDNKQSEVRDAANRLIGKYFFDGEGKRVKKEKYNAAGLLDEVLVFVYSGGKLIAEYSTTPPPAPPEATTRFTVTDQPGSPRVILDSAGDVVSRRDFLPFGEEIAPDTTYRTDALKYGQTDHVRQKFTGYQNDAETGLDFAEARMYENRHGRFTAVDPLLASGKSANPQTFNRYVYVANRPLAFTDPTGLQMGSYLGQTYVNPQTGAWGNRTYADANPHLGLTPYSGKPFVAKADDGFLYLVEKFGGFLQIGSGPDPLENPIGYELSKVEEGIKAGYDQFTEKLYRYSPDYCKAQCSIPVLGGLELTGDKDMRLYFGGGKSVPSDVGSSFLDWVANFGKNGNWKLKGGCSFTCGYFEDRGMSPDERRNALEGANVTGTAPIFPGVVVGGNQSYPLFSGPRSYEAGYGVSGGVSVSGSGMIFDFKDWMKKRNAELMQQQLSGSRRFR